MSQLSARAEKDLRLVEMALNAANKNNEGVQMPPEHIIREAQEFLKWAKKAYDDL